MSSSISFHLQISARALEHLQEIVSCTGFKKQANEKTHGKGISEGRGGFRYSTASLNYFCPSLQTIAVKIITGDHDANSRRLKEISVDKIKSLRMLVLYFHK